MPIMKFQLARGRMQHVLVELAQFDLLLLLLLHLFNNLLYNLYRNNPLYYSNFGALGSY